MRKLIRLLFTFLLLSSPSAYCQQIFTPDSSSYVYPGREWETVADPATQQWDVSKLLSLNKFIVDSAHTTGLMIVHRGRVVFTFGDVEELSYIASCRKSVLAMLYGPFIESGKVNLNKTLRQLGIDDIGGLLPVEKQATIRNLLSARSGVYHPASNEGDQSERAPKRGSVKPGSFFLYNNWDFNAAGYILERETDMKLYDILDSVLARPLKMQDFRKDAQVKTGDRSKSRYLAHHMVFSTRDMARLGYLMLRNGRWQNQQILPAKWVKTITAPVITNEEATKHGTNYFNFAYGYMWWLWDTPADTGGYQGAYSATGAYGQFITVLPQLDLVIAHKTNYIYQRQTPTGLYLRIVDKILQAKL